MKARLPKSQFTGVAVFAVLAISTVVWIAAGRGLSANAAGDAAEGSAPRAGAPKTGVLLVSHGSRSASWRKMLLEFHDEVEPRLLDLPGVSGVKSAFMEYTEPSIATRLKEFDAAGYDRVILVPLLLTVSSHSFDDIPTIIGAKEDAHSLAAMKAEGIERYVAKAQVSITPLLDFSELLESNLPRRVKALSRDAAQEGVVLVAYGDEGYDQEWTSFFSKLGENVRQKTGVAAATHCWCGHIVRYSLVPTKEAIRKILNNHERAIVIPVLVARDEMFQDRIIGKAVEELAAGDRVAYVPDSILPDGKLTNWVIEATRTALAKESAIGLAAEERRR